MAIKYLLLTLNLTYLLVYTFIWFPLLKNYSSTYTCSSSPTCCHSPRGLCCRCFWSPWRKQCLSDFTWILFCLRFENGILLPKLFWPTVRKNCSSDREKLLKFEAEGREFSKGDQQFEIFKALKMRASYSFWDKLLKRGPETNFFFNPAGL